MPGISSPHDQMETENLSWVGVSGEDGTFRGVVVDPESKKLKKSVRFTARTTGPDFITPHDIKEEDW